MANVMSSIQENWFGNFLLNICAYGVIILPAALFIHYFKNSQSLQQRSGPLFSFFRFCILGNSIDELELVEEGKVQEEKEENSSSPTPKGYGSILWSSFKLCSCIIGLQIAYLTWGVLQERVMTRSYGGERFTNSQFLVFVNRVLALCVSAIYIASTIQPRHISPFYKYSYSSLSNILSSWCQYEALKFVSFPTQVLAKSCKVMPVMLMGKVVSNKTYPLNEYVTALMMSGGVALFLLAADPTGDTHTTETTVAGILILGGYMMFDSFTSNWQSELFRQYKMSPIQMMLGVNTFSCIFTIGSLLLRGTFFSSVLFLFKHWDFGVHASILSICSAIGQLFIFYTISQFGPLVFTLIMTTRQAVSILLSCIVYGHILTIQALLGVVVVFIAILLRFYFKQRERSVDKTTPK